MSWIPPHSQDRAIDALAYWINHWREQQLTAARAAYFAEHGASENFPPDGPVIPEIRIEDPSEPKLFDEETGTEFSKVRALRLYRRDNQIEDQYGGNDGAAIAARLQVEIEWIVFTTTQSKIERLAINRKGRLDIHNALTAYRGLPDPNDPSIALAADVRVIGFETSTDNIGMGFFHADLITVELLLDTVSLLT